MIGRLILAWWFAFINVASLAFLVSAMDNLDRPCAERAPPIWPDKFVIVQRIAPTEGVSRTQPGTAVTYYDRSAGANLIIITPDDVGNDSPVRWDLELNDGTSYYFQPSTKACMKREFPVGILRTDWLSEAEPLGESVSWDGSKSVCGWTKVDFIDYYADKETMEPVSWYFHIMKASFNVLYYGPGASVPNESWFQPPDYCLTD